MSREDCEKKSKPNCEVLDDCTRMLHIDVLEMVERGIFTVKFTARLRFLA